MKSTAGSTIRSTLPEFTQSREIIYSIVTIRGLEVS